MAWSVAAALSAATLSSVSSREASGRIGSATVERAGAVSFEAGPQPGAAAAAGGPTAASAESVAVLETRWLIAPDPDLDPPIAAPLDMEVDPGRGRLLVLEGQPIELRVYGLRDGAFRAALGREGDGPGEYRYVAGVAVAESGLTAVLSMSGRVTFWRPDGTLAGGAQVGPGMATDIVPARADSFYVKSDLFPPADVAEFRVAAPDTVIREPRYRDRELPGTEDPGLPTRNHSYAIAGTREGELLIAPPGPEYVIVRVGPDGVVRRPIRRPEVAALRRSEEEIEAVRERVRQGFARLGRRPPDDLPVPLYRPHIRGLSVSPDGTIWAVTGRGDEDRVILDSFAPDGTYLGSYAAGLRTHAMAATDEALYFLAEGELDVVGVAVATRPRRPGERAPAR